MRSGASQTTSPTADKTQDKVGWQHCDPADDSPGKAAIEFSGPNISPWRCAQFRALQVQSSHFRCSSNSGRIAALRQLSLRAISGLMHCNKFESEKTTSSTSALVRQTRHRMFGLKGRNPCRGMAEKVTAPALRLELSDVGTSKPATTLSASKGAHTL